MAVKKQNFMHELSIHDSIVVIYIYFCILIGLLARDNPCVHGQFMPPSLSQKLLNFDWLLSFEIVIARNYKFLHGITLFCTELQSNCTALDQSESSNFFMYMINSLLEQRNGNEFSFRSITFLLFKFHEFYPDARMYF